MHHNGMLVFVNSPSAVLQDGFKLYKLQLHPGEQRCTCMAEFIAVSCDISVCGGEIAYRLKMSQKLIN